MGVYLHVVDLGMPGWDAMRDWKIQSNIARTNGTSGYNRSIPNTYIRAEQAGSPAAPAFADWAAMWNHNYTKGNASEYFVKADLTQAHMPAAIGNFAFITMTAGNLNWAARQGVPNTSGSRTWLNHEMAGRWAYQKWAIS